jgi:hypothetical protein
MNWKAKLWWRVWEWWDRPHHEIRCRPDTFCDEWVYYKLHWLSRDVIGIRRVLKLMGSTFARHSRALIRRAYWRLRWWSQLRCNGNAGGWRTEFCNWLEQKARHYQYGEDTE